MKRLGIIVMLMLALTNISSLAKVNITSFDEISLLPDSTEFVYSGRAIFLRSDSREVKLVDCNSDSEWYFGWRTLPEISLKYSDVITSFSGIKMPHPMASGIWHLILLDGDSFEVSDEDFYYEPPIAGENDTFDSQTAYRIRKYTNVEIYRDYDTERFVSDMCFAKINGGTENESIAVLGYARNIADGTYDYIIAEKEDEYMPFTHPKLRLYSIGTLTGVENTLMDGGVDTYYDITGHPIVSPSRPGVYIVRSSSGDIKKTLIR